jgi:YD repeat-containing protein
VLFEPAPELVIDWERPPPKGAPAAARRASPSQLHWELWVDQVPEVPVPLDDVSRPCRRQHFLPHDTRPLRTVDLRYDAAGRLVRERHDDDTDGTIDFESTWTWGADGRLERERHRTGKQPSCGGTIPESVEEVHHRHDAHGVWLGGQTTYDGRPEPKPAWRTTTYDPQGRLTSYIVHPTHEPQRAMTLRWSTPGGPDELVERVDYVGPSPRRIERWHDAADGSRWHAVWSGEGWTVSRTVRDADGRPLVVQHDADGNGRVDGRTVWTYDAQGRQRAEERDTDGDGDVDERIELEHDAAGFLVGRVHTGPAGTRRETWQLGPGGQLLRWTSKLDESWVEDVEEHVYDVGWHELERRIDRHQAVGSASDVRNYVTHERWRGERDGQGRLLRAFLAAGELGPDERVEYVYDCKEPYHRHPRRNPLDHPERAEECMGFSE